MNRFTLVLFFLAALFCANLNAQTDRQISGQVKDAKSGETIPGVNVYVKDQPSVGTVTDPNGKYSFAVPASANTLVYSSVGYATKELAINGTTMDVSLDVANNTLDAVVISASRKQEKILDAPASISLITSQQLQDNVSISPSENLKSVPGVDIMNTGLVQTNVVVRGFNNIFSGALLTMVDNRYATVPSLRVNVNMFIPTDNSDLDRIEVLRGPASALYGPDCSNGVVHMITKMPLDQTKKFETTITQGIGFRGKVDDTIQIANPINPVTDSVYADYKPEFDFEDIGDRLMYSTSIRNSGKLSDKFGYKILGTYFAGTDWRYDDPLEPAIVLLGTETATGRVPEGDSIENNRNENIRKLGLDGALEYRFNSLSTLILSGGFTTNDDIELTGIGAGQAQGWKYYYAQLRYTNNHFFGQIFMNGSNAGTTYLLRTGDLIIDHSKQYAAQAQYSSDLFKKKLSLVYGVDALLTRPDTQGTIDGRNEDDDNITEIGGYAQGDYKFNEKFDVIAALRLDYHNFVDDPFLSPRGGIVYKPNHNNTFRATYNRAFSSPSSNNLNLDILQLADLGDLGAFGQSLYGLDYLPGIGARAVGNRGGFTFAYDDAGLPMFHSPYALAIGDAENTYYSLGSNNDLNNITWNVFYNLLVDNFVAQSGLNEPTIRSLLVNIVPDSIFGVQNSLQLLNLTTGTFEPIDPSRVTDYGGIKNSPSSTYEVGWKGNILDKFFITLDVYTNTFKDFVSPLTNITPNVFLDNQSLNNYLTPVVDANYNNPDNAFAAGALTAFLDPVANGGNGNGTGEDELLGLLISSASGVPMGTVVPTQYDDAAIYVTYVNIGDITVYGTDLGITWYPNDDWRISVAYSWVNKDSIAVEGAQLGYVALNAPKNKAGIRINYDIKKIDLNVGVNFRWQEGFPANSGAYTGHVDDVNDMDVTLNYRPHYLKGSQFSLQVSNVYNHVQQYFIGAPYMGRSVFFKVGYSF